MTKQQGNMDDFIREEFQNYSSTPPEHVWEGIKKGLEKKPFAALFLNNWKTVSLAIIMLLAIIFSTWYFFPHETFTVEEQETAQEKRAAEAALFLPCPFHSIAKVR